MQVKSVDEAKAWLAQYVGQTVYLHMEVNPQGYIRNVPVLLKLAHIHGDGAYRVYLEWEQPNGIVQLNDVTDFYEENGVFIFTAYDNQSRIAHSLEVSPKALSM
ncbi:DUF1806 family protein [Alicyclobacillus fastidiosus]|uniref:DUF1806 family protein n=1 Tax=Alicyclobacillus fastidiosus TaxID=392011 RepID=A0ABV5ADF8_9BACL|nr:DUF1806 family protein [Alicyclobacillus fastidiosus]WEH08669.1 DUF1806 family protein [Alicyclobacillus fastidiosus]